MSNKNPTPSTLTYEILTAFIHGVNDAHQKLEMRRGIDRRCLQCSKRTR